MRRANRASSTYRGLTYLLLRLGRIALPGSRLHYASALLISKLTGSRTSKRERWGTLLSVVFLLRIDSLRVICASLNRFRFLLHIVFCFKLIWFSNGLELFFYFFTLLSHHFAWFYIASLEFVISGKRSTGRSNGF